MENIKLSASVSPIAWDEIKEKDFDEALKHVKVSMKFKPDTNKDFEFKLEPRAVQFGVKIRF